ncbi:MAG: hypothetical protein WD768_12200 [Phycisphaeraceae bacterium]
MAVVMVGVCATLASAIVGVAVGFPRLPAVHDEFSYLLAADTYSRGRLTNPSHPMASFFETIHVLSHPTYMSKYPPVQGMTLASGQLLTGYPIVGAWLGGGLMAAAICWMLQGFMPPRWALLGGVIAALQFGIFDYWVQTYWGGSMAAVGGALVIGAVPRIVRQPLILHSIVLGVGLIILANSRPFEGLVFSLVPAIVLLRWVRLHWRCRNSALMRGLLPAALVVGSGFIGMAINNTYVTGEALRLPYVEHLDQYSSTEYFLWNRSAPAIKTYVHPSLANFHVGWERDYYLQQRSLGGVLRTKGREWLDIWEFFIGWVLTVPLIVGIARLRQRRYVAPLLALLLVCLAASVETWCQRHYIAPTASVIVLLFMLGVRRMSLGLPRTFGAAVAMLLVVLVCVAQLAPIIVNGPNPDLATLPGRDAVIKELESMPGDHLLFVRVGPGHVPLHEWVFNGAEIDSQQVVVARYFDIEENQRLIGYYPNRKVWVVDVNSSQNLVKLRPYPSAVVPLDP